MLKQSKDALTRDKEKLEAWLASFTNSRESNRKSAEYLRIRRLQLISQLSEIFPIQVLQSLKKSNLNCGRIHNPTVGVQNRCSAIRKSIPTSYSPVPFFSPDVHT